jgi:phage-related protein
MKRSITFYRTSSGKCPIEEFLDSLDSKAAQKVTWMLRAIEELNVIPENYLKKISGPEDIWECRVQFGNNAYRILCFFEKNVLVLTHGFSKKTRRTPETELVRAINYKRDFFRRRSR